MKELPVVKDEAIWAKKHINNIVLKPEDKINIHVFILI